MAKKSKRSKAGRSRGSGGGTLTGFRSGFKNIVGTGKGSAKKKESTLSKIITYLLLAIAIGLLIYRFTR